MNLTFQGYDCLLKDRQSDRAVNPLSELFNIDSFRNVSSKWMITFETFHLGNVLFFFQILGMFVRFEFLAISSFVREQVGHVTS